MSNPLCLRLLSQLLFFGIATYPGTVKSSEYPHSSSRPDEVSIKHLHLDLKVDFDAKRLIGSATLKLERNSPEAALRLDIRELEIDSVVDTAGHLLTWKLGEASAQLGQSLVIDLAEDTTSVTVSYQTSGAADALQWLAPEQTTDKKHPFLFTQSQAILARTWVPCQDTPAVRMTYSAKIQVPPKLMAVMSAANPIQKNAAGVYEFEMQQPIPSYLLALAVGDLEFEPLGPRSGVYAEPSVLKRAAWELADTEKMISAAEKLYGPYAWQRYDVIFLPSSFPFGGMENPRLTFATPTILAGDRSLVALIAHELAHSWSGNLVTNATWNDFWLNEGFTVYFEQRIMEAVYGRKYSEMLARLSLDGLRSEITQLDERDTWLKLDLAGRNPDDGMTSIAYDKGYFFLRRMEEAVGRQEWDAFLKGYFTKFAFRSMTTEQFIEYLKSNLSSHVEIEKWIYAPGLPKDCPEVQTSELASVEKAAAKFLAGTRAAEVASRSTTDEWTTHHWNHFLRTIRGKTTLAQMQDLDRQFKFTESGNSEITHDWLHLVIENDYKPGMKRLREFLTEQGRRKFLQPLYQRLCESESGKQVAREIYSAAREGYHSVSQQTIDEIVGHSREPGN